MSDAAADDLFADSDDEEVKSSLKKPATDKAAPAKKVSKPKTAAKGGGGDDDDEDDLLDSDDDIGPAKAKASKAATKKSAESPALSKRERLEALAKKKRVNEDGGNSAARSGSNRTKPSKDSAGANASKKTESGYDSEDSYDSATFQRTQDDDDFIDTTGEDADALAELYAPQTFEDDRPMDEIKKKKRKLSDREGGGSGIPGEALEVNEDGVPVNPIMAAVHKMKRKKREKRGLEEVESEIRAFLGKMELCAEEDEQAIAERRPALSKLQFLAQVEEMLGKRDMQKNLLDFGVLSLCKRWIQPLPNGKLGNVTIRQRLLTAVAQMNNGTDDKDDGITDDHLRQSELGKVVMILLKHPDETVAVRRLANQLIEQWSRLIFKKSGNMRDLGAAGGGNREGTGLAAIKRRADFQQQMYDRQEMERKQVDNGKHANLQSLIATGRSSGNSDAMAASANRVRVPYSKGFAYSVRPKNKTDVQAGATTNSSSPMMMMKGVGAGAGVPQKDTRGKLVKRMTEKGRSVTKNQRSANISVEGRATKG